MPILGARLVRGAGISAVTLSIVAVGFATFRIIAEYFPVFEAHSQEKASDGVEETEADPVAAG